MTNPYSHNPLNDTEEDINVDGKMTKTIVGEEKGARIEDQLESS